MEGEINTPPIAEPLCSRFTLAGLCLDLISCPGGSNRAALPGPTLHPRELRFLSHHKNSLSICWSRAPNFVLLLLFRRYFGGSALYWHSLSHFLCVSLLGSLSGSTKPRSVLQSGTGPLIDYSCSVSCTFDMMGLLDWLHIL